MTTLDTQLEALVATLNEEIRTRAPGTTASVQVHASAVVSLAFDKGEVLTVESLQTALYENFLQTIELGQTGCLDGASLVALRSEV
jgi:hypothetical protein